MGLATWGWRIVRVLGVKLTAITPCRGFTMETTTALVTAFGSYLGLPLSTTQTHVGSTTVSGLRMSVDEPGWSLTVYDADVVMSCSVVVLPTGLLDPCLRMGWVVWVVRNAQQRHPAWLFVYLSARGICC